MLATVVRQRTAEIGIRMALGAQSGNIFKLVVGQGLRLTGIGIALGLIAAPSALTRGMTTMLVGVKPSDPANFCHHGGSVHRDSCPVVMVARVACGQPRPHRGSARRVKAFSPRVAVQLPNPFVLGDAGVIAGPFPSSAAKDLPARCEKFADRFVQEFLHHAGSARRSRRVSPQGWNRCQRHRRHEPRLILRVG